MTGIETVGRIVLVVVCAAVAAVLALLGGLLALSPGKPRQFRDENGRVLEGSISEKIHVIINGTKQGMFIMGRDTSNPVLLYLHGGAGMPEYFLAERYPTGLDQYFTVCWWDRRGAGLSYRPNLPPETLTLEQSIADALEVTNYLRKRFHREKIYVMAHSGGSLVGIQSVAREPGLFHAYVGIAQMSYQLRSEMLSYEHMRKRYRELGNGSMVKRLEAAPLTMTAPLPVSYMKVRDEAMHGLGVGTTREMRSVYTGVFLVSLLCKDYTIGEKIAIWRGKFLMDRVLWDAMITTDLATMVTHIDVPVYFFHGKYDHTVSYPLAKAYLEKLRAPIKGFYTFERSAHSPMFEEPGRMVQIISQDVLAGKTGMAD